MKAAAEGTAGEASPRDTNRVLCHLQMRVKTLNGELGRTLQRWYLEFRVEEAEARAA
jgi:hypothetical protein